MKFFVHVYYEYFSQADEDEDREILSHISFGEYIIAINTISSTVMWNDDPSTST